jgi:hypothetical protein
MAELATQHSPSRGWVFAASLIGVGLALHFLFWRYSEPSFLFSDFYKAYFPAAQRIWQYGPREAFTHLEPGVGGFVNLPILVWLFVPLSALGLAGSGWAFLALGLIAVLAAWWLLVDLADPKASIAPLLLFLFLVDGPLINSLREGNSTHFVLLLLVAALVSWKNGRLFIMGVLLGMAALIKIPLLLLGVYFLLRGHWRIVLGGAAAILGAVLLSLLVHGIAVNVAWYEDNILPYIGRVIPAFNVQSIDAFLMRLSTGEDELFDWTAYEPSLTHKIVRIAIFILLFGSAFWLMARRTRASSAEPGPRDFLELSIVTVLAVVASPVSWSHYYLLMLLPMGLYVGRRLPLPDDRTTRWLMWGGFALTALPVILLPLESGPVLLVASRTVLSAWLFGGLLMLAALMRGLYRVAARREMGL